MRILVETSRSGLACSSHFILAALLFLPISAGAQYIRASGAGAPNGNQYYFDLAAKLKAQAAAEEAAKGGQQAAPQTQVSPIQSVQQNWNSQQQTWQNVGNRVNQILQQNNQFHDNAQNSSFAPGDNSSSGNQGAFNPSTTDSFATEADPQFEQKQPYYAADQLRAEELTYGGLYPDSETPNSWVDGKAESYQNNSGPGSPGANRGGNVPVNPPPSESLLNQLIGDDNVSPTPSTIVFPGANAKPTASLDQQTEALVDNAPDSNSSASNPTPTAKGASSPSALGTSGFIQQSPQSGPPQLDVIDKTANGNVHDSGFSSPAPAANSTTSDTSSIGGDSSGQQTTSATSVGSQSVNNAQNTVSSAVLDVTGNVQQVYNTAKQGAQNLVSSAQQLYSAVNDPIEPAVTAASRSTSDQSAQYNVQAESTWGIWLTFSPSKITTRYQNLMTTQVTTPATQIVNPDLSGSADSLSQ